MNQIDKSISVVLSAIERGFYEKPSIGVNQIRELLSLREESKDRRG